MILQTNVLNHEIPKRQLTYINREASVLEASKLMRKSGATELLVAEETDGMLLPLGIMTANDIVMRVIALGLDPAVMTAGDIAWPILPAGSWPRGNGRAGGRGIGRCP